MHLSMINTYWEIKKNVAGKKTDMEASRSVLNIYILESSIQTEYYLLGR